MRALITGAWLVLAGLGLSGCETIRRDGDLPEPTYEEAGKNSFGQANYRAVAELMQRYGAPASVNNRPESSAAPFIVATVANIDQLEQSSTLGRLISEQVSSRLSQMGHQVVELKLRNGIYMKRNEGEFLLTREIKEVASAHRAQAVVLGTYAESASYIHVSLKLVNPANSMILSAHDYALPLDRQVRSMLRKSQLNGR